LVIGTFVPRIEKGLEHSRYSNSSDCRKIERLQNVIAIKPTLHPPTT
jgi:hypothetical protein